MAATPTMIQPGVYHLGRWAPETTLYELVDNYGDPCPVLAMPYLPDDGSVPDPALLAEMRAQTGGQVDRLGGNYVVRDGRPYVVDGCTVDLRV